MLFRKSVCTCQCSWLWIIDDNVGHLVLLKEWRRPRGRFKLQSLLQICWNFNANAYQSPRNKRGCYILLWLNIYWMWHCRITSLAPGQPWARPRATEATATNIGETWWRHRMETFSALLALCAGYSPVTGEFPHKGQWRGALMFSLICAWINGWVNNREAGDLGRLRAHYDAITMKIWFTNNWQYCHNNAKHKYCVHISCDVLYI